MSRTLVVLIIGLFFTKCAFCQSAEIPGVFHALKNRMNSMLPVCDSMPPTFIYKKGLTYSNLQVSLSKGEFKELRKTCKKQEGLKIDSLLLPGVKLISAKLIFRALVDYKNDTVATRFLEDNRPFYMLSRPLFFSGLNKAIVNLTLLGNGGYGVTYLLVRKDGQWLVEKELQ